MTGEQLARALEIARTTEPPQRETPCRNGHDPQYSYLGGSEVRQWRCSLCRLHATARRDAKRQRVTTAESWRPGRADLRVMRRLGRISDPLERLRIVLDAWREITGCGAGASSPT